jgi:LysM repeat protein
MRKITIFLSAIMITSLLLVSCQAQTPSPTPISNQTQDSTLRPYPSGTPTPTPWPTDYSSPTPSPTITPTATPVYYEVLLGDDMYSIAFRFQVSPEAIMTANPDVDPRAMKVGTKLLIPITPKPQTSPTATIELSPTATPRYKKLQAPDCYPDAQGGLWCFVLVQNQEASALENVSGILTLQSEALNNPIQIAATTPLNVLPAGKSLPLIAYFPPPLPETYNISAVVDFLLPVMPDDDRYLPVQLQEQTITFSEDKKTAEVQANLSLASDLPPAEYVWVSITALDSDGRVVGARRWDSPNGLSPGETISFNLSVFSMGETISDIQVLAEAQAVTQPTAEESDQD